MPRKSTRKDKTIYQIAREERGLSLEAAAEQLITSKERLAHIEARNTLPTDDDICLMAKVYEKPTLCNEYCATVCKVGQAMGVTLMKETSLAPVVLHVLDALGKLSKDREKLAEDLVDISADQCIEIDEVDRFVEIQKRLRTLNNAVSELDMWVKTAIANKNLDGEVRKRLEEST